MWAFLSFKVLQQRFRSQLKQRTYTVIKSAAWCWIYHDLPPPYPSPTPMRAVCSDLSQLLRDVNGCLRVESHGAGSDAGRSLRQGHKDNELRRRKRKRSEWHPGEDIPACMRACVCEWRRLTWSCRNSSTQPLCLMFLSSISAASIPTLSAYTPETHTVWDSLTNGPSVWCSAATCWQEARLTLLPQSRTGKQTTCWGLCNDSESRQK